MASIICLRSCLFFNVILNGFWLFFYLFLSRNQYKMAENNVSYLNDRFSLTPNPISSSIHSNNQSNPSISTTDNNDIDALFRSLDSKVMNKPYIFVGGVPSSGTTLIRAILDAHPDIRCGEETRIVPRMLQMRERWRRSAMEHKRLIAAGLNDTVIDKLIRSFVSNVIELHGPKALHLCNKDPLSLSQMPQLHNLFPKAKFLLIIRDGRAVANSIVSRNITITGVNQKSYVSAASFWNRAVEKMVVNCNMVGKGKCLRIYYEKLVDNPKEEMSRLLDFLNIPWSDNVLHHSDFLSSEVSLSRFEPSTKQVKNAIDHNSADKWKSKLPLAIQREIWSACPMLKKLGYKES